MNIQDARCKAENVTRSICDDLDYDLKVEEKTSLSSKNIVAGNEIINDAELEIARAIMHEEDTSKLIQELEDVITEFIKSYLETSEDE